MTIGRLFSLLVAGALLGACDRPAVPETDDDALRIVTLAPHLTEMVFAVGADDHLVGVSAYSDYPPEASNLPIISDAFTVDQEQLALLAPTLILAWDGGNPRPLMDELSAAGYRVEPIRTHGLADIPLAIERIGELADAEASAEAVAREFREGIEALRARHAEAAPVTVFYQISSRPLYTIGGTHFISDILTLCGGNNVFGDLAELAPPVSVEAVVDRNPDVMLAADGDDVFGVWERWPHLEANRLSNHFTVEAGAIGRPSIRLLAAASAVCEHLETARRQMADSARGR